MNLEVDKNSEMLRIESNGETLFFGNYHDFDIPNDLIKLLDHITDLNIKYMDIEV